MDLLNNPAFIYYALAAATLSVQLIVLAFYTGGVRAAAKRVINPEDALTVSKGAAVAEAEAPAVQRAQRAHQNLIENALPFFVVGWLYVLTGASPRGAAIYFGVFVGARVLHSVAYLLGKQPYRTILFAIGALATLGMAAQIVLVAVKHL